MYTAVKHERKTTEDVDESPDEKLITVGKGAVAERPPSERARETKVNHAHKGRNQNLRPAQEHANTLSRAEDEHELRRRKTCAFSSALCVPQGGCARHCTATVCVYMCLCMCIIASALTYDERKSKQRGEESTCTWS